MENNDATEIKKTSLGNGNRSFLHRNADSKLEGLALKRKTLPLQLIRNDIVVSIENGMQDDSDVPITPTHSDSSKQFNSKESLYEHSEIPFAYGSLTDQDDISKKNEGDAKEKEALLSQKFINHESTLHQEDTGGNINAEIIIEQASEMMQNNKIHTNNNNNNNNNNNENMNRNNRSSNGINFKVKPKWAFSRNVMTHYVPNKSKRTKKLCKPRIHEAQGVNVVNVSEPTNFVYLAGTAEWPWLDEMTLSSSAARPVITHEEKFAKLSMVEKEMNDNGDSMVHNEPRANSSFLWSSLSQHSIQMTSSQANVDNDQDNYDDVGILSPSTKATDHNEPDDVYDDVGPCNTPLMPESFTIDYNDEQVYDDVVSPIFNGSKSINSHCKNSEKSNKYDEEDDLIYMGNNYSSVEEDADDESTLYDDVGINCQSRVNSLYAGGMQLESEWEDLEEISPLDQVILKKNHEESQSQQSTQAKKKINCRWSRKVRRQRSKALRKNSSRTTSPAVRISSLSLHSDTASDDSNYETLCSEFMSEPINGFELPATAAAPTASPPSSSPIVQIEPPLRPVPPPPRESSLTGTFGKRIKILKRTWSITKGSLGRMRRKTSTSAINEADGGPSHNSNETPSLCENYQSDPRKMSQGFNFKKHFQRTVSSHSTFYLDKENDISKSNNHYSIDDTYTDNNTTHWFGNSTDCWPIDSQTSIGKHQSASYGSDDYNMLAEEPLYQFYAAATVRGAFQTDSDSNYGGEDDNHSSLNLASTTDLGKPGHRTLWCETPQVKNSSFLEKLSADDKKLQEAKFEIVTSEASYLNSLRVLVNEFLINHELVYEILSTNDREKLFGKVPAVLIGSEKFLGELESIWQQDPMLMGLPNVLLQHAERSSKIYIDYCSNQVSIDATLKDLRGKKSKFAEAVTRIEAHPACHSLSLHSFLMLPMQRVTRLPLLADAVLSKLSTENEERLDWERVVSELGRVVADCNEAARTAGRQIEMETLSRKLVYSAKISPIDLRERYLVRSGPVTQMLAKPGSEYVLTFRKRYHKNALYLLLLTDYLLVAKHKTNTAHEDTYIVIDAAKRSLVELEKVPDDSPFAGRHAMILTLLENHNGRHIEYILSCQNTTERERWLDAVCPPKPNLVGETLYETWDCPQVMALYSYTPTQPDELALQPGDVINVLRKMADGWNHGEKLVGGQQGWFPGNFVKEVASEHVRARNLRQRHRLLALSESLVQQRANLNRSQ